MLNVSDMQRYLPAGMKFFLKRYYRTFFPNKLILIFNPTSRCNYRCSYCPVITKFDYTTVFPKKEEKSVSEWLGAFEQLPAAMIYIAGGEPFEYPARAAGDRALLAIERDLPLPAAAKGQESLEHAGRD